MYFVSNVVDANSGAARMSSSASDSTSETESTTTPTTRDSDVEDDDDREVVVLDVGQAELHAQVQDGHDHAAQVDHALDERRRVGDGGGLLVAADLLHLQDLDAVAFRAQAKGQELALAHLGLSRLRVRRRPVSLLLHGLYSSL